VILGCELLQIARREMVKNLLETEEGSAKMMRRRLDETGVWRERT
jgi:hypothetical protein